MRLIQRFIARHPWQSLLLIVLLILAGAADGIGISALLPLLNLTMSDGTAGADEDSLSRNFREAFEYMGMTPTLGIMLLILISGICIKNLFLFFTEQRTGYIAASITTELRMRLLRAITSSQWRYFIGQSAGSLANSMATEAWRASLAYTHGVRVLALVLETIVYTVLALLVSWQATLICLAASLIILLVSQVFVRISKRAGRGQTHWYRSLLGTLTDLLGSVKTFKAMGRDEAAADALSVETKHLKRALKREVLGDAALTASQEPMYMLVIVIGIYIALEQFSMEISTVLFLSLVLTKLLRQFGKVQKQYQRMSVCESAYWALDDTITEAQRAAEVSQGTQQPVFEHQISLQGVSYSYGEHKVLDSVSLVIPARQMICLIGESGSGKTTIVDLVTGLMDPDEGEVRIDGVSLRELDMKSWRRMIGYVPQENLLLHDTIHHNVTLGDESISDEAVEAALRAAGAWDFVARMPEGVMSVAGERGGRLSGGQRQRVMIARALAHGPRLLILDESTSALDPASEASICETLDTLKREITILAVSHQTALATIADKTLRLDKGQLREIAEPMRQSST
jgi:ATP-binding cassette, subfamily C, bacterial